MPATGIAPTDSAANRTTMYDPDHAYQVSAVYLPTNTSETREHQAPYAHDTRHRLSSAAGHAVSE